MSPPVHITGYLDRIQPIGSERHLRFDLYGVRVKFGRGYNNDLVLPLLKISRHHAEFRFRDDHWEIKDLSQNGICVNYERVTHRDYVVLENNDIISFVPNGSVDYRFVSGGTLQTGSDPAVGQMSAPLLPAIPGPSTSRATMVSPNSISGIGVKRFKVETTEGSAKQTETNVPKFDDGSSSIRSADTEFSPRWIGSPSIPCLGTPAYCYDPAEQLLNQRRHCQQRIESLESELQLLRNERESWQGDLQSARSETQERIQGQLMQVLEDDLNCVICSDVLIEPTVVECGHVFCSHCITVWIEERKNQSNGPPNCPSCRADIELPRRVRGWDAFFSGVYKLLSTEAQENRQEILQQRQEQYEGWEAELVVQRAEQEETRQRRLEEERARAERQARVEARARANAERASIFIYNELLRRYMAQEARGLNSHGGPTPADGSGPSNASETAQAVEASVLPRISPAESLRIVRQVAESARDASQSAAVAAPYTPPVVRPATSASQTTASVAPLRPPSARPAASVARPSVAGPDAPAIRSNEVTQSSTVVRSSAEAARFAHVGTATESISHVRTSGQVTAAESYESRNGNGENNWSRLSVQDAFRALDMNNPILQLHRVDASNSNNSASQQGENTIQQSLPSSSITSNRETRRTGTLNNGSEGPTADSSSSRPLHLPSRVAVEPAIGSALNPSTVPSPDMPPPPNSTAHYDQHAGISGENRSNLIIRLGSSPVIGNERHASLRGSQNGSQEQLRAIRIPPLAVHPSRFVPSPAPDHRVPSPAPSLASNSSNLSDPFARAGGISHVGSPLWSEMRARVVNNLSDEQVNQLDMNVGQNERHEQEQQVAEQQPQRQGSRNVARRGRPFQPGAIDRSNELRRSPAPAVSSVRGESRRRHHRRRRSHRLERRVRQHLSDDEARMLNSFLEYLTRPPSETETRVSSHSRSGSSRSSNSHPARNDDPEVIHLDSPEPEFIDDDLQILYESSHPLS